MIVKQQQNSCKELTPPVSVRVRSLEVDYNTVGGFALDIPKKVSFYPFANGFYYGTQ
jgi:hypothetical protein